MVVKNLSERYQLEQLLHEGETGSLFLATENASPIRTCWHPSKPEPWTAP